MSSTTYVIITGMHRSGTSMLSGALGICGLDIGSNFRPPPYAKNNPKGYFEDLRFKEINRDLMKKAGFVHGSFKIPKRFVIVESEKTKAKIRSFRNEWDKRHPVGWKDPRACLTLKIWKRYLKRLKVIVIERPAEEIAASLKTRNGFVEKFSNKATVVYLSHLDAALKDVDHQRVHYHDFFIDFKTRKKNLLRLCDWIGIDIIDNWEIRIDEFVDKKLWRHRCS